MLEMFKLAKWLRFLILVVGNNHSQECKFLIISSNKKMMEINSRKISCKVRFRGDVKGEAKLVQNIELKRNLAF